MRKSVRVMQNGTSDGAGIKQAEKNNFKNFSKTLPLIAFLCYNVSVDKGKRLLGVDFGLKRVGYAVCDSMHVLATPLCVYHTKSMRDTIDYTAKLCVEQEVGGIVVGLPLNLDGSESVQSGRARALARNLQKVTGLPVELFDERLTTVEADELLLEAGIKRAADRAKLVDSMAAKVILQSYIETDK